MTPFTHFHSITMHVLLLTTVGIGSQHCEHRYHTPSLIYNMLSTTKHLPHLGGGSSPHGASQSGSQTIATGSMSAPTLSPNNPPLYVALRHLIRGVSWSPHGTNFESGRYRPPIDAHTLTCSRSRSRRACPETQHVPSRSELSLGETVFFFQSMAAEITTLNDSF